MYRNFASSRWRRAGVAAVLLALAAGGCASSPATREKSSREWLDEGRALAAEEDYDEAIAAFKEGVRGYRDADLDAEIQVALADAYFAKEEYPAAVEAYGEFLRLHPHNSRSDWAQFRIGVSWQRQMRSLDRSQEPASKAAAAFEALLLGYPRSERAAEARAGLDACRRRLAEHELYVGEFYLRTRAWAAAAGRFETVLRDYEDLGYGDRALAGLGRSYEGLRSVEGGAQQFERLRREFPDSRFLKGLDNQKG